MKKILYIIGAILLVAGCTQTDSDNELQPGSQDVVLRVSPDFSYGDGTMEPMGAPTRAAVTVNHYVLELYTQPDYSGTPAWGTSIDGKFTLSLDRTRRYYCLLWADDDAAVYNTDDLQAVTLNAGKLPAEAFFGRTVISGADATISVSLKRAVAKINLCDKNGMQAGRSVHLQYTQLPVFNTATGAVSGTPRAEDYNITSTAAASGAVFGGFWLLASPATASAFDLTFRVGDGTDATTVNDITYQANRRTNVTGEYAPAAN